MPFKPSRAHLETAAGRLRVTAIHGREAIGRPYRFDLSLRSDDPTLDGAAIMAGPVTLELHAGGIARQIHGVLKCFEQGDAEDGGFAYRAVLVPRLALLGLGSESRIYQSLSVPEIVMAVLARSGSMNAGEIELRLERDHPRRRYVVQYEESNLAFIMRLLEDAAIGMAFEHQGARERLVLSDENRGYAEHGALCYRGQPKTGVARLESLRIHREALPAEVFVRDHDPRAPYLPLEGRAVVDPAGVGLYADPHTRFDDPRQGPALARLRAEELRAGAVTLKAVSEAPLSAGVRSALEGHFRADFNQPVLLTEVRHELEGGVYRAHAAAIFADVPFRPRRVTPKPRLHGTMHAKLDASGPGEAAAIDADGRYRVIMPFDLSGADEGCATAPMPLVHPYGGPDEGIDVPLPKGAEVVWTCLDGDPDRPVLTGTLPAARVAHPNGGRAASGPRIELRTGAKAAPSAQQHASTTFVETTGQAGTSRTDTSGDDTWFKVEVPHTAPDTMSYMRYGEQAAEADDGPRAHAPRRDWLASSDGLQLNGFSGTAARITSQNAQSFALQAGHTLVVGIDGGGAQTITFAKHLSAAEVVAAIDAVATGLASSAGGKVTITSPTTGETSAVAVGGTAAARLFGSGTSDSGSASSAASITTTSSEPFDVGGLALSVTIDGGAAQSVPFTWNATAAEVVNQINATLDHARAIAESDGKITILSGTTGTLSKVHVTSQPSSSSASVFDFSSAEATGTASTYDDKASHENRTRWQTSGVFDYTDRNRTVVTRGNYEELIGGSAWRTIHGTHRFVIKKGGLGTRDASVLFFKDMKESSDGTWYSREVSHAAGVTVSWGDTQSYSAGYSFGARLGFDNSVFVGAQTSCSMALSSSISVAGSVGVSMGASVSVALEKSWSISKTWTCSAEDSITLKVHEPSPASLGLKIAAMATAGVAAGAAVLGSAITAGAAAGEAAAYADGTDDSKKDDAERAIEGARGVGIAAGPIMAVAGAVTAGLAIASAVIAEKKRMNACIDIKKAGIKIDADPLLGEDYILVKSMASGAYVQIVSTDIILKGNVKINGTLDVSGNIASGGQIDSNTAGNLATGAPVPVVLKGATL